MNELKQYEILRNGERFAYSREPFGEEDEQLCLHVARLLQKGRLAVHDGFVDLWNYSEYDITALDVVDFTPPVESISYNCAHPSVVKFTPSTDTWTVRPVP